MLDWGLPQLREASPWQEVGRQIMGRCGASGVGHALSTCYSRDPEGGGHRWLVILPLWKRRSASRLEPGAIQRITVEWAWARR